LQTLAIKELTLSVTTEVPFERIRDLLSCALDSGFSKYWCVVEAYVTPKVAYQSSGGGTYKHLDYPLSVGGATMVRDEESDGHEKYRLDLESIQRGLDVMARKYPNDFGSFMAEEEDSHTGDMFLQCCLLGGVLYA
jgi:hypothetical protein